MAGDDWGNPSQGARDAKSPESCYTISDPELRNLCRARAQGHSDTCYTIMDPDARAYCRALTQGAPTRTYQGIRDE